MASRHLIENKSIRKVDPKDKIYCQEPYAQELYDMMYSAFGGSFKGEPKDMMVGDTKKATIMSIDSRGIAIADTDACVSVLIDLNKEKPFFERQRSYNPDFNIGVGSVVDVAIDGKSRGTFVASMGTAFNRELKNDLRKSLEEGSHAYTVTVKSVNDGGFLVDLQGLECFMPGSLAGANKILDFHSMIGKKVVVMVEAYLQHSDTFVVSAKKYIQRILPAMVKELDFSKKYSGTVTGTASYGAFVEWEGVYTGLLHESEMADVLGDLRPGSAVDFYVKDIREGNRIILSQKQPSSEALAYQDFKADVEGGEAEGRVKEIKPFGVFIEFENGVVGMMPPREFRKTGGTRVQEGDVVLCYVKSVDVGAKKIQLRAVKEGGDEDESESAE
jgi:ribosomal protein S1